MDFASIPGIALIVYVVMELFAGSAPPKLKPAIAGVVGVALGLAAHFTIGTHPDPLTAGVMGLLGAASAAGVHGTIDHLADELEHDRLRASHYS